MTDQPIVAAHAQKITNHYVINYPAHEPRKNDPHYADFREWKRRQKADGKWRCAWAALINDDTDCDLSTPLEAHHSHIEIALLNAIDFDRLEHVYPGISDRAKAGAWIDSDANLTLLCAKHHRGQGHGVHHLSASDYAGAPFLTDGTFADPDKP